MCKRNIDQLPLTHPHLWPWPTTQSCALTRNQTGDLWVCSPALNPLSHTSQGNYNKYLITWKSQATRDEKGTKQEKKKNIFPLPCGDPGSKTEEQLEISHVKKAKVNTTDTLEHRGLC